MGLVLREYGRHSYLVIETDFGRFLPTMDLMDAEFTTNQMRHMKRMRRQKQMGLSTAIDSIIFMTERFDLRIIHFS